MSEQRALLPNLAAPQVDVDLGAMSHPGKVRPNNEDHYLVAAFERSMKALLTSLPERDVPHHWADVAYGMLVADGMGGAAGGEVASRTAISALIDLALRTPDWIMRVDRESAKEVLHRLNERILQAEATLVEKTRTDPSLVGMGTTMTVACSTGADLLIAHVGDSRAYLFRKGELYRLTSDHTVAQALASAGAIPPESVKQHPMRNVLTHVVGSRGGQALADLSVLRLNDGDQIMLCTDGLTDMVDESALTQSMALERPAAETCSALVQLALENGGRDNVTVVIARYRMAQ